MTPTDARTILAYIACIEEDLGAELSLERRVRCQAADALRVLKKFAESSASSVAAPSNPDRGTPHRCPVCDGAGRVGYLGIDRCPTCKGERILWSKA